MSSQALTRIAAVLGILGGLAAIGGGLYAHFMDPQPIFGIPGFMWVDVDWLSGVHQLVGLGALMVVGGLIAFKWPTVGICIVCAGAMIGLIACYDRGRPIGGGDPLRTRWIPYLYYWAAPWVLAWISGIFAGLALYETTEAGRCRRLLRNRPIVSDDHVTACQREGAGLHGSPAPVLLLRVRQDGAMSAGAGYASRRIVTGPSLTSSTCMCAPKTPVCTGTPAARTSRT